MKPKRTTGKGSSKKAEASLLRSSAAEYLTFVDASGKGGVEAVYADENVWLSQKAMGLLYDVDVRTISYHLKNVFSDSELEETSVIQTFRITASDGKTYATQHYSLPAIIAVGYKVNSERAVEFRKWATGKGAHAWVFFASRISARDARRLGTAIISHTCARTRQLKLESYDRLFPNQDTRPEGGFGNLIALPLQKYVIRLFLFICAACFQ